MTSTVLVSGGSLRDIDYMLDHWTFDKLTLVIEAIGRHNKAMFEKSNGKKQGRAEDLIAAFGQSSDFGVKTMTMEQMRRDVLWQGEPINKRTSK